MKSLGKKFLAFIQKKIKYMHDAGHVEVFDFDLPHDIKNISVESA